MEIMVQCAGIVWASRTLTVAIRLASTCFYLLKYLTSLVSLRFSFLDLFFLFYLMFCLNYMYVVVESGGSGIMDGCKPPYGY